LAGFPASVVGYTIVIGNLIEKLLVGGRACPSVFLWGPLTKPHGKHSGPPATYIKTLYCNN